MNKLIDSTRKYFKDVKIEMSKVTWPGVEELKASTVLVIIVSVFFAVYIGALDFVLNLATRLF